MRFVNGVIAREEHLYDLMVVIVCGKDEGRDVWRELTFLLCPEERVTYIFLDLFLCCDIVGMFDNDLNNLGSTLTDSVKQSLLNALKVELVKE